MLFYNTKALHNKVICKRKEFAVRLKFTEIKRNGIKGFFLVKAGCSQTDLNYLYSESLAQQNLNCTTTLNCRLAISSTNCLSARTRFCVTTIPDTGCLPYKQAVAYFAATRIGAQSLFNRPL